jgi:transcriptional regulator with GAF, ATPase, and Fis domain
MSAGRTALTASRIEDDLLTAVRKLTSRLDVNGVCEAILAGVETVFAATSSWILTRGRVILADAVRLDNHIVTTAAGAATPYGSAPASSTSEAAPSPPTLADAERTAIIRALRRAEGRISGPRGAAALLGLKPTTLHAKLKRLGLSRRDALGA